MINRIIPLLLFIGFVWGQADLDKLVKERLGVEAVTETIKKVNIKFNKKSGLKKSRKSTTTKTSSKTTAVY